MYFVNALTWNTCQSKDCCCSACAVLHQAKATQWNISTTRASYRHCSQAEKRLIQQMIALIGSAWGPSPHHDSKQHEDMQSPTLSPTQFQSQLATSLIWTHSGRILASLCPRVAETPCSLAYLRGNGGAAFHILLFNEHSTPLSSRDLIGSHAMHHLLLSFRS